MEFKLILFEGTDTIMRLNQIASNYQSDDYNFKFHSVVNIINGGYYV